MDKTQVITKDEDKVLDAELYTDLLNQSERDKIVKAGNYLEAVYDGITDPGVGGKGNTIKEKVYGKLFKEKGQESHHYIKLEEKTIDENGEIIAKDLNEKANRVQALVDSFAADLKYKGETPRILIGDLPPGVEAFASPENNTIAIDRKVLALADANKVLTLVGHELGHFNSYDANTESTAKRVEDAIQGTKNKGKYTEKIEKEFQEKYAGRDISGNEAQKVIDGISEDSRENFALTTTIVIGGVVLIGSYYSGQKTKEYLESEEGKKDWNKFEENLKEEWETKKNKGIAYAKFYQASLEAFLTDKVGIKDIVISNKNNDNSTEIPLNTNNPETKVPPIILGKDDEGNLTPGFAENSDNLFKNSNTVLKKDPILKTLENNGLIDEFPLDNIFDNVNTVFMTANEVKNKLKEYDVIKSSGALDKKMLEWEKTNLSSSDLPNTINGVNITWSGKPHTNTTPGHWSTIVNKVLELGDSGDYKEIYANKGITTSIPGAITKRRPDIVAIKKDGTIEIYEVPSNSDTLSDLRERMEEITKDLKKQGHKVETGKILNIK